MHRDITSRMEFKEKSYFINYGILMVEENKYTVTGYSSLENAINDFPNWYKEHIELSFDEFTDSGLPDPTDALNALLKNNELDIAKYNQALEPIQYSWRKFLLIDGSYTNELINMELDLKDATDIDTIDDIKIFIDDLVHEILDNNGCHKLTTKDIDNVKATLNKYFDTKPTYIKYFPNNSVSLFLDNSLRIKLNPYQQTVWIDKWGDIERIEIDNAQDTKSISDIDIIRLTYAVYDCLSWFKSELSFDEILMFENRLNCKLSKYNIDVPSIVSSIDFSLNEPVFDGESQTKVNIHYDCINDYFTFYNPPFIEKTCGIDTEHLNRLSDVLAELYEDLRDVDLKYLDELEF